jgi:predicted Co/Zn/Cd cation transporter (cation efflux family)
VAIDAALALIVVLLVVQMWLLSATLGAFLNGRRHVALPAAVVSIVLCAGCVTLAGLVNRLDRQSRSG